MATNSPKRVQRVQPKQYSTCLLYNTKEAKEKLKGLSLASCNPTVEGGKVLQTNPEDMQTTSTSDTPAPFIDGQQLLVSDKMSCNFCDATFLHRIEQKRHYRSDWHRYNLKQRIKAKPKVTEAQFEDISGNISSLSGSDSDSDSDSDEGTSKKESKAKLVSGIASRLKNSNYSSTDSESDAGYQVIDNARRLPKLYFRNGEGELLSVYRCVICHKKEHPARPEDIINLTTDVINQMNWAVFMVGGGHFAAAIYNKDQLVAHKTFHRYVVRAKRGTAQSSRDSQGGNAPKSAGASLRRYNEAALTQEIHDLIASWSQHISSCDRIFLRAPSFNRKIFFGGKNPPMNKDDPRIRLIPFQTRRPTFNEVRRVFEMLASLECYGDESELQDLIPISPPQVFNPELGQLTIRDDSQLTTKQRKLLNKKMRGSSPLVSDGVQASSDTDQGKLGAESERVTTLSEHGLESEQLSSGTSTGSETELMEAMETINLGQLKEFYGTKKPKRRKKSSKQRRQTEPESNVMDEEKYHLKNSLYTACKVGDTASLKNLLAIFSGYQLLGVDQVTVSEPPDKPNSTELSAVTTTVSLPLSESDNGKDKVVETVNSVDIVDGALNKETLTENSDASGDTNVTSLTTTDSNCSDSNKDNAVIDKCDGATNKEDLNFVEDTTTCDDSLDKDLLQDDTKRPAAESEAATGDSLAEEHRPEVDEDKSLCPKVLAISLDEVGNVKSQTALPDMSPVVTLSMLNECFGDNQTTLLHVAAREGHRGIVAILMESGANPAQREKTGHTPYMASKDKATRNEFRKFMGRWPDKYDYTKAQIPMPLTEEMEEEKKKKDAEKKKAAKKLRQERQKVQREEEAVREREEREKKRFLHLSDREKRALAAERRLVSQVTSTGGDKPVLIRCFQCGADMTGKTPFEYLDNKFCTSKCLQQHRKSQVKS